MKNKHLLIFLLCFISIQGALGQQLVGLRAGATVEKKLTKRISISAEGQLRYTDNFDYLETYLFELGASYKLNKHFELAAYYRFFNKKKDEINDWNARHRYYGEIKYDTKIGPLKFEDRLRYQHQFKDNDGEIGFDKSYFRNKFELNYPNKSNFTPYVSADFFYLIGDKIDQVRPKAGFSYKLNKQSNIKLGMFKDIGLNGSENNSNLTVQLEYKFKF